MKILALDQASKCGFSIYNDNQLFTYGNKDFTKQFWCDTVHSVKEWMLSIIDEEKIELVLLEDTTLQSNPQVYKDLTKLLGVLEDALVERDMQWVVIKSSEWKSTCGVKGKKRVEQKLNCQKFVKERFDIDATEDEADAIAIGWHGVKKILNRIGVR